MSGSSLDGLDIAYCILEEIGGKWSFEIASTSCIPFDTHWESKLATITTLPAKEVLLAHSAFGKWMGIQLQQFIQDHQLQHKIHLIASHGHTVFHDPANAMTFQLGDGATIAAITNLPVVSDLRNMDIALGGQGAPIVPIGEKLFWNEFDSFLNIGGISNITVHQHNKHIAFDVCPANKVLNLLAQQQGQPYDKDGILARSGNINLALLDSLNQLDYYAKGYPKSLANEFGTQIVYELVNQLDGTTEDKLRTYTEHIAIQIANACNPFSLNNTKMLITGGGALNTFLMERIADKLNDLQISIHTPDSTLIQYKEALVMALIGTLRWREETNVLSEATGASRASIGGALWMGHL